MMGGERSMSIEEEERIESEEVKGLIAWYERMNAAIYDEDERVLNLNARRFRERATFFGCNYGEPHIRGAPVMNVFSVTIHSSCDLLVDGTVCEVYGVISVIDEDGNVFDVYNRDESDAEKVSIGGTLSLDAYPVAPATGVRVSVSLREKAHEVEIAAGSFSFDCSTKDDYHMCKLGKVQGKDGFASVLYTVFQCAVIATVKLTLYKNIEDELLSESTNDDGIDEDETEEDESEEDEGTYMPSDDNVGSKTDESDEDSITDIDLSVHGRISAWYGKQNDHTRHAVGDDINHNVLLEKSENDYLKLHPWLGYRQIVELSRCVLAVPVQSSLIVGLDLWDAVTKRELICASHEFTTNDNDYTASILAGEEKLWIANVKVDWNHPEEVFEKTKRIVTKLKSEVEDSPFEENQQSDLQLSQPSDAGSNLSKHNPSPLSPIIKHPLGSSIVEVFSLVVGCYNGDELSLCGKIKIGDDLGSFCIFAGDETSTADLSDVLMKWPKCSLVVQNFRIVVKLKDIEGRFVSRGFFEYPDEGSLYSPSFSSSISWYDRRLCSVIRGEHGYVALHYIMFSSAIQAAIKVVLYPKSCNFVTQAYGSMVARYSTYSYSNYWEREYFQSVLFKKPEGYPMVLSCGIDGSEIPLLKSVVSTPTDCSLVIDVDLMLLRGSVADDDIIHRDGGICSVKTIVEVKPYCNDSHRIEGDNYYLILTVEWSCVVDNANSSS